MQVQTQTYVHTAFHTTENIEIFYADAEKTVGVPNTYCHLVRQKLHLSFGVSLYCMRSSLENKYFKMLFCLVY